MEGARKSRKSPAKSAFLAFFLHFWGMKQIRISEKQQIGYYMNGPKHDTPIVLLHGFCEDSSVWAPMLPHLDQLPLIRMDLPGFGGSDVPPSARMEHYADALHAALHLLDVRRCVLIGHSLGGYIAQEFLLRHPEMLAGVGLFHSHPYPDNAERIVIRKRGIEMLQQGKKDLYVSQLFPGLFAPAYAAAHPEVVQALIEKGKQQPAAGIIAAIEAMIERPAYFKALENAHCPVQFLLGAEDAIIPLDGALKAAAMPAVSDLHVLQGVGHMGMWEAPEQCAQYVREFYALVFGV